jgi:ubiquitin-protein ligase
MKFWKEKVGWQEMLTSFSRMATQNIKRKLLRELKAMKQEGTNGYSVEIVGENIMLWKVWLFCPCQTDWEGAVLQIDIKFSTQYPIVAPEVRFNGVIPFHPNVYATGKICLDLLQHNWSAAYNVDAILTALQALLQNPNPSSPANSQAADLFVNNIDEYRRCVRKCVESTWTA